ncbi:MAG: hypothetical protein V3U93_05355 [Alphaproteobacteria bacterium]
MVLSDRELYVLLDLVETKLAHLLVNGCEDRSELAALKQCRWDLRTARAAFPHGHADGLSYALRRDGEAAALVT